MDNRLGVTSLQTGPKGRSNSPEGTARAAHTEVDGHMAGMGSVLGTATWPPACPGHCEPQDRAWHGLYQGVPNTAPTSLQAPRELSQRLCRWGN